MDIKKLISLVSESGTSAGSVASVSAPMGETHKRVEENTSNAPQVIEYGNWENSALTTSSKLKKERKKAAKIVKSIYGEDTVPETANPKQQAAIAIAKKKEVGEGKNKKQSVVVEYARAPIKNREDYLRQRKAIQDLQMQGSSRDKEKIMRMRAELDNEAKKLGIKLGEDGIEEGKFTVNAKTGAKLDPRTGAELPPKEKPLTMKDMFRQPKSTAPKLSLDDVWREFTIAASNVAPDIEPYEDRRFAQWLKNHGITGFKIGDVLDAAAKKHGYDSWSDYSDSIRQYARDNMAEATRSPRTKKPKLFRIDGPQRLRHAMKNAVEELDLPIDAQGYTDDSSTNWTITVHNTKFTSAEQLETAIRKAMGDYQDYLDVSKFEFNEGVAEGYKEPTDAAGHLRMAKKIKKMLDDTLADRGDRHGNADTQRLTRAYEYHMEKATEKSQGVAEGSLNENMNKNQAIEILSWLRDQGKKLEGNTKVPIGEFANQVANYLYQVMQWFETNVPKNPKRDEYVNLMADLRKTAKTLEMSREPNPRFANEVVNSLWPAMEWITANVQQTQDVAEAGEYGIPDIPEFAEFYNKKGMLVGTSDHNGFHFTPEYYKILVQDFNRAQIDQMAIKSNVAKKLQSGAWTVKQGVAEGSEDYQEIFQMNTKQGKVGAVVQYKDKKFGFIYGTQLDPRKFDRAREAQQALNAHHNKQGVAEGENIGGKRYEMMMRNGQVKKFVAKDDADAIRIAKGHGAKSVIKLKGNVPGAKILEQDVEEGLLGTALDKAKKVGKKVIDVVAPDDEELLRQLQRSMGIPASSQHGKKSMAEPADDKLDEADLIINPASMTKRPLGLLNKPQHPDHEVGMAKSDLYQASKNALAIFQMIRDVPEEVGIEGWVQEKIIKANDYLNTVREYLEGKQLESMDGVAASTKMFTSEGEMEEGKTGPGLWANIHAKRKRIKAGSGERMRKPGSKGAPKASDFRAARSDKK